MSIIIMVIIAAFVFYLSFEIFRDKRKDKMIEALKESGFEQERIIFGSEASESSLLAYNQENNLFVSRMAKDGGICCCIVPPESIVRWFEHEEKDIHTLTIVFDDDNLEQISFPVKEKKNIANAISLLEKLASKSRDEIKESVSWNIPPGECRNNVAGYIFGALASSVVVAVFAFFGAFTPAPTEAELAKERKEMIEQACSSGSQAISYSRQFIRNATRPTSISFVRQEDDSIRLGECEFSVFGAIDGENAFGARVRNYYTIRMEGRVIGDTLNWYGGSPMVDSNRQNVYRVFRGRTMN